MNIPDHISESLETIFFGLKILKFFGADADPRYKIFYSWFRDGKNSDPGFGINIPDPQYRVLVSIYLCTVVLQSEDSLEY
jgi:hypothetical protein